MTIANLPIAQRVAHLLYPTVPPIIKAIRRSDDNE